MTVRRMALGMLILTAAAALFLVLASHVRYTFYMNLMNECNTIISESNQLVPIEINENIVNKESTVNSSWAKIVVLSADGYPKEFRYYHDKNLVAVDKLDEGEKIVRRDILDKGPIRIQLFYGPNGNLVHRYFLDEDGKIIDSKFVPFVGGRTGYR